MRGSNQYKNEKDSLYHIQWQGEKAKVVTDDKEHVQFSESSRESLWIPQERYGYYPSFQLIGMNLESVIHPL